MTENRDTAAAAYAARKKGYIYQPAAEEAFCAGWDAAMEWRTDLARPAPTEESGQ